MAENEQNEPYLTIFLSAAPGPLQKEIDDYIETKLGHEIIASRPASQNSPVNIEQLEQDTEECSFAIVVLGETTGGTREKQLHEIGYCQGTFGYQNVLVLRKDSVPEFANMTGMMYEVYSGDNIKATFPRIRTEIDAAIARFVSDEEVDED